MTNGLAGSRNGSFRRLMDDALVVGEFTMMRFSAGLFASAMPLLRSFRTVRMLFLAGLWFVMVIIGGRLEVLSDEFGTLNVILLFA